MKEDQRVLLTKRLLQDALLKLLSDKDINKIKISELCKEAGINRATFYRHYELPKDILTDIRKSIFMEVKTISDKYNTLDNLLLYLEETCTYYYNHKDILIVLFKTRSDDDFVDFINESYSSHLSLIKEKTDINDHNSLKLVTYYISGGMFYMLRQWILDPIDISPKEMAELIYKMYSFH